MSTVKKQGKDEKKLSEVSKYFTEATLENILCTLHNGGKAEVLSWDFGEASAKGDGYLSTVNKVKITGTVDGIEREAGIVVKSLPTNQFRRKIFRSAEFFSNEIIFYTKVIPKFEKFLKSKGQSQLLHIPRYLVSVLDGENDYIVLEDVSLLGYGRISRQDCADADECITILKTLAQFHAISFAYKDQHKEEFIEISDNLHETYLSYAYWDWYKNFHRSLIRIAKNALEVEYPDSNAQRRFASFKFGELFKKSVECCSRQHAPTSVITQGDSWPPNFLARNVNGKIESLMLDFQLARCGSTVLDISFCIYSSTKKPLRDAMFDELLKIYHNELSSAITALGSDPEKLYPWNTFMNEVKEQFVFGVLFAMEAIPFAILDESEVFDLDELEGNVTDINEIWKLQDIKTQSGRLRLADVIVHATERGFL